MGTHAPQQRLTAISRDGGRGLGLTQSIACFPSSQTQEAQAHCQLPFPDKFTEAAAYVAQRERSAQPPLPLPTRRRPPAALNSCCSCPCPCHAADGDSLSEESKLLLYSLHQQATVVGCRGSTHVRLLCRLKLPLQSVGRLRPQDSGGRRGCWPSDLPWRQEGMKLASAAGLPLQGPCNEPKPWGWSVVNNAKWQSWKQLGDMAAGAQL